MYAYKRRFGFCHASALGVLDPGDGSRLQAAAQIAKNVPCNFFELCGPVNNMNTAETAGALRGAQMLNVSYCRFFPETHEGANLPFGDPVGNVQQCIQAKEVLTADVRFMQSLRRRGIRCGYIVGPNCFVLGKDCVLDAKIAFLRMREFLISVKTLLESSGITFCVKYLGSQEDRGFLGGIDRLIELVDAVDSIAVKCHLDTYSMLERDEDPVQVIKKAGDRIGYFHAHSSDMSLPGDEFDPVDWRAVAHALDEVGYYGPIVPKPFGPEMRQTVSELTVNYPSKKRSILYYSTAQKVFTHCGIL